MLNNSIKKIKVLRDKLGRIKGTEKIGRYKKCLYCSKKFWAFPSREKVGKAKYCSKKCWALANRGKHFSPETELKWRNGNTPIYMKLKNKFRHELKEWRIKIFERDNYTCQDCGIKGIFLNAHHKKSFVEYPELRFNLLNGITLCRECHHKLELNFTKR